MAWGVDRPLARRPMTPGSESQVHLAAARPTTMISLMTTTTFGTWNVRTMYETGKAAQVATKIRNYRLSGRISTEALKKIEERKAKKAAVNNSRTRTAKLRRKRSTKGRTGVSKRALRQTNATIWSRWQQRLKRQLIMEICGTFMLP